MKKSGHKLTLTETAEYLGVSRPRVYEMVKQGLLKKKWINRPTVTRGPARILGFDKREVERRKSTLEFIKETVDESNDYLTVSAAAEVLNVTTQRIHELCTINKLKYHHIAHRTFIKRSSVFDYKKKRDEYLSKLSV